MKTVGDVLSELGYRLRDCGNHYRIQATFRESRDYNIAVDKSSGKFVDFARGTKGDLDQLVLITLGSDVELSKYLDGVELVRDNSYKIEMPKIFDPSCLERLFPNFSYWTKRSEEMGNPINEDTLKYFKNGVAHSGRMLHRSVFPVFNPDGKLYGFSGRLIIERKDQPKWKHVGRPTQWVYPYYFNKKYIHEAKKVILVESIGDMLSLWEGGVRNTLVLFSTNIGSAMFKSFIEWGYDIEIALNNDDNKNYVGNEASVKNFIKLAEYFDLNRITIKFPSKNDFGDMSYDDVQAWKKTEQDTFSIIRSILRNRHLKPEEKKILERLRSYDLCKG